MEGSIRRSYIAAPKKGASLFCGVSGLTGQGALGFVTDEAIAFRANVPPPLSPAALASDATASP
jgi:hypothetical protein